MHDEDHGHSPAAWTGVTVMLVASALGCWAAVFGPAILMWVGLILFGAGGLIWFVLAKAGVGESRQT